jgi:hypothetical protein
MHMPDFCDCNAKTCVCYALPLKRNGPTVMCYVSPIHNATVFARVAVRQVLYSSFTTFLNRTFQNNLLRVLYKKSQTNKVSKWEPPVTACQRIASDQGTGRSIILFSTSLINRSISVQKKCSVSAINALPLSTLKNAAAFLERNLACPPRHPCLARSLLAPGSYYRGHRVFGYVRYSRVQLNLIKLVDVSGCDKRYLLGGVC